MKVQKAVLLRLNENEDIKKRWNKDVGLNVNVQGSGGAYVK